MYNTPLQPLPACFSLGPAAWFPHGLILLLLLLGAASWGDDAVGGMEDESWPFHLYGRWAGPQFHFAD